LLVVFTGKQNNLQHSKESLRRRAEYFSVHSQKKYKKKKQSKIFGFFYFLKKK